MNNNTIFVIVRRDFGSMYIYGKPELKKIKHLIKPNNPMEMSDIVDFTTRYDEAVKLWARYNRNSRKYYHYFIAKITKRKKRK